MIHRYVSHNDRLASIEDVRLSPGQAGLLSGWGIFTTVRIFEGIPFAFERHWKRLAAGCESDPLPVFIQRGKGEGAIGRSATGQSREGGLRAYLCDL